MPFNFESPQPSPGPKSRTAKKVPTPTQLYLRSIADLTIHGGIAEDGRLVMIPIYSGIGAKVVSPKEAARQAAALWLDGALQKICPEITWADTEAEFYNCVYPAINTAWPLPSPGVIDKILHGKKDQAFCLKLAHKQLLRCSQQTFWREFRLLGQELANTEAAIAAILVVENQNPGLLTPGFLNILLALQEFHEALAKAEVKQEFCLLDFKEMNLFWHFSAWSPNQPTLESHLADGASTWQSFAKKLKAWNVDLGSLMMQTDSQMTALQANFNTNTSGGGGEGWGLIVEMGAQPIAEFLQKFKKAQGIGSIKGETDSRRPHVSSRYRQFSEKTGFFSELSDHRLGLKFCWQILLERANQQHYYSKLGLSAAALHQAYLQRYLPDSTAMTLFERLPSRPIAEGGALIIKHLEVVPAETNLAASKIQIQPAILKPEVAAVRLQSRAKQWPLLTDRYDGLSATELTEGVPTVYSNPRTQMLWPQGKLWQTIDLGMTLAARPELLLNPEVLADGVLTLSLAAWEQHESQDLEHQQNREGILLRWQHFYNWFYGVNSWHLSPIVANKGIIYWDRDSRDWPIEQIHVTHSLSDVRLAVRFNATSSDSALHNIEALVALIQNVSKQSRDLEGMSPAFMDLRKDLTFKAQPYFIIDSQEIEAEEWFAAVSSKRGYRLANGMLIDGSLYLKQTDLFILRQRAYAKFQTLGHAEIWLVHQQVLKETEATLPPEVYIQQLSLQIAPILQQLDDAMLKPLADNVLLPKLPELRQVLRPYQLEGLSWCFLRLQLKLGVCLADEMGLGKTLQAIALLRILHKQKKPSLIVMPKTLLINWQRELARFGGDLRVHMYGASVHAEDFDVCLISYPRLRLDQQVLAERDWNLVVLDEAQAIKNSGTQVAEAARLLKADYRLALTGTPVENRAAELWSLINWLNPGYLGQQADFAAYTQLARASSQKSLLLAPLRESLNPVILRRLKSDPRVALGLPAKINVDLACELSEEQTALYQAVMETILAEDRMDLSIFARRALFLKAILYFKQICIHPDLFYASENPDAMGTDHIQSKKIKQKLLKHMRKQAGLANFASWLARSAKLTALRELVEALNGVARGILIFSQYRGAAELVRRALADSRAQPLPFLHGNLSIDERGDLVDEFNESCRLLRAGDVCPILILSLKAGGTGLNLTGADRVIHLDRWWNPAVEDQATDRAHRIGQERSVFVHTITSQGTIEAAIAKIFAEKRQLADDLLGAAEGDDTSEMLKSKEAWLDLVDPDRVFSNRLLADSITLH